MSEFKLTESQQAVVDNIGGELLVSAAAGSGKTKVLIDRLMKQICDRANPANLDEFLIITYTKAAAAELRGKISKVISEQLANDPENLHLQRQSARVCMAQISTVHSFCTSILRSYAHMLDIPADFRVAEEGEVRLIQQEAMQSVLDEAYRDIEQDADLRELVDRIGYGRDDRNLASVLLRVYNASRCRVYPDAWLDECAKIYDQLPNLTAEQTPWGKYLIERFHDTLNDSVNTLIYAAKTAEEDPLVFDKYAPLILQNIELLREHMLLKTWDEIYQNPLIAFGSLPAVRKPQNPQCKERVKQLREYVVKAVRDAQSDFYAPSDAVMQDLESTAGAVRALLKLVRKFSKYFLEEKRRKHLLDFSDLEHESIRLLTTRDGKPTQAAAEIAEHYREIMVDEYQDSNAVQEHIFNAISRNGKNRFMVGDVKQSIYRFRLADPEIFLKKYDEFALYTDAKEGQPRKILLSENFRSRDEILEAVNDVFYLIMNRRAGELDYTEDEALKCGGKFDPVPQPKVELHCMHPDREVIDDESAEKCEEEAEFVADRIERMLREKTLVSGTDGPRPVRPDDIVILMRAPGSAGRVYAEALAARGIATVSEQGSCVLFATEAEILTAIMQIIDNPHRDIALVTVMCSPIFMFTPDELAKIRAENEKCDLFTALNAYSEKSEKLEHFLQWIKDMRQCASVSTLRELFDTVLQSTTLEEVFCCMADGEQRGRTIDFLRTMVDSITQTGGGLLQFNRTVEQMIETDTVPVLPKSADTANAVRILSIHKSKGLEFPVVFLADLSRKFNANDRKSSVLLDDELGVGCNIVDVKNKSYFPGIARLAIGYKMTAQSIAEEMRVLYVAMTRAKDMLIMTYCSSYMYTTLQRLHLHMSEPLRPDVPLMAKCLGDWVLMAALCRTEAGAIFNFTGPCECSTVQYYPWVITLQDVVLSRRKTMRAQTAGLTECVDAQALCAPLHETYAFETASSVPSKLTATQLKGRVLDKEASDAAQTPMRLNEKPWRQADFTERTQLSASEKGSAVHLFMQYVHLASITDADGIEKELHRMVEGQFLSQMQADAIDCEKVRKLFASELGKRILSAENLRREFKFSILTDAGAYYPDATGEQVMLQGVVDCFWVEDGKLVIVDFKTDRIFGDLDAKTENYRMQLETYADALGRIFEMPVKEKILYFFDADTAVTVQ